MCDTFYYTLYTRNDYCDVNNKKIKSKITNNDT